jgi:TetR/AcrR family transcriptional repressor of nem operon
VDAYLSPQHRDNPGEGCPIAALAGGVAQKPADQTFLRGGAR